MKLIPSFIDIIFIFGNNIGVKINKKEREDNGTQNY